MLSDRHYLVRWFFDEVSFVDKLDLELDALNIRTGFSLGPVGIGEACNCCAWGLCDAEKELVLGETGGGNVEGSVEADEDGEMGVGGDDTDVGTDDVACLVGGLDLEG